MTDAANEYLRAALEEPVGEDFLHRLARMSLLTVASRDPGNGPVLREYEKPERAELDLHLDGGTVTGHETDAHEFGRFVQRMADSVHATARSGMGRQRMKTHLKVVGAEPGSVRVLFRAPENETVPGATGPVTEPAEAVAMRTVTSVLDAAQSDIRETLTSTLAGLDGRARTALRQVAQTVVEAGWSISGELKKRGWPTRDIHITSDGAERIVRATEQREVEEHVEKLFGRVNSWVWSDLVVGFRLEQNKRVRAVVLTPELQQQVADLVPHPGRWVDIWIRVITTTDADDAQKTHTSRVLERIESTEATEPLVDADQVPESE